MQIIVGKHYVYLCYITSRDKDPVLEIIRPLTTPHSLWNRELCVKDRIGSRFISPIKYLICVTQLKQILYWVLFFQINQLCGRFFSSSE